jgi:hypothetical protein
MAAAKFWDVFELKTNVFTLLREDKCNADLARCARVHHTWMDFALSALWYGYPKMASPGNQTRTRAIALLPRVCRQNYASRVGVLDFTNFGGVLVHAMFDGLVFPKLQEVILHNVKHGAARESQVFRLWKYMQPALRCMKLIDRTNGGIARNTNWLTIPFLAAVAQRSYNLQEVFIWIPNATIEPADLARFFGNIQPRTVSLDLGGDRVMLTSELLAALSHEKCLESLESVSKNDSREQIEFLQLQRFLRTTAKPFPYLKRLDLFLEDQAASLIAQCFPAVTWLRLEVYSARTDESVLKSIANMSQLQFLEIVGDGSTSECCVPARAFIALGSLTQLKSLSIGTSFFPCCMSEDDSETPDNFDPHDKFTRADASNMFSGLVNLEHLSICIDEYTCPDHLYDSISRCCPQLSSLELLGSPDLQDFVLRYAPTFYNLRQMTLGNIKYDVGASQAARLIDNLVPRLERLSFKDQHTIVQEIYSGLMKLRSTQGVFRDTRGSRVKELVLKGY